MKLRRSGRCMCVWAAVAAAAVPLVSGTAAAQTPNWGAQAISTIGDIRVGGGQSNFTFDAAGGAGIPVADTEIDDAVTLDASGNGPWDRGDTRGFTGLTFAGNQVNPMRAEANLSGNRSNEFRFGSFPAGAIADSGVFVSDLFQYTGPSATTLALTYTLDGVLADPPTDLTANALTVIAADVAVFADTPDYDFVGDIGTLVFELGATLKGSGGVEAVDQSTLVIDDDTAGQSVQRTTTLRFDVVPGETFYVWQTLTAQAAFGTRSADAFSTLRGTFDQPEHVRSLVPEPGSWLLLAAGAALTLRCRAIR